MNAMTTDQAGVSTGGTTAPRASAKARRALCLGSAIAVISTMLVTASTTGVSAEETVVVVATVDATSPSETTTATPETLTTPLTAREAALQRASRAGLSAGSFRSKAYGIAYAREWASYRYKWSETQVTCLTALWNSESSWRWNAKNRRTGAYGIAQALPGKKMAIEGSDWKTNPETQIRWGLRYIAERHLTPCKALSYKRSRGWY